MILLELFWSFMKIGFTSFGGLSMVPLISSEMLSHGWMTASEVSDIVAIAEMTPGPLAVNCASFCGMRTAGVIGTLAATLGVLTPTLTLCLVCAIFFEKFKNSRILENILLGVRPACVGLILGVAISLCRTNYLTDGSPDIALIAIAALDFWLLLRLKLSIPKVIGISAALGLLTYFI